MLPNLFKDRLGVADGILKGFISQSVPLRKEVDPQHSFDPDRRPPSFSLGITRLDQRDEPPPWHHLFHLSKEALSSGRLLLPCVLARGKTQLVVQPLNLSQPFYPA